MEKIEDAVTGVLEAMRRRGIEDYSIKCINWSIYRPFINWHHTHGLETCAHTNKRDMNMEKSAENFIVLS